MQTLGALPQYKACFAEQEVDLLTFLTLNDDDLRELGVQTFGARRKMTLGARALEWRVGALPIPSVAQLTFL